MEIIVRPLKLEDYEQVKNVDILTQIQYLGENWENNENNLISKKSEFETNANTGFSLVAEINEKLVGFLFAHETLPFPGTLHIRHIAILPEHQGKGIGVKLYEKLVEIAKAKNIQRIESYINDDNPNSQKLHEKVGFRLRKWWRGELRIK